MENQNVLGTIEKDEGIPECPRKSKEAERENNMQRCLVGVVIPVDA